MKKLSMRRLGIFAMIVGYAIMTAPLQAGAAGPAPEIRQVWTVTEAEIARQAAAGVPLKDIINGAVKSGDRIHVVVAAAVKVGIDPSQVVQTSIAEGYAARTVVTAAVKSGAPLQAVLKSAANAGMDRKDVPIGEIIALSLKSGTDPSLVVSTCIIEGYDSQAVVKAALKAGAPLNAVVKSASDAGADNTAIYVGAADAGESPLAVESALSAARNPAPMKEVSIPAPSPAEPQPSSLVTTPAPALFGMGGVVLTQIPVLSPLHLHAGQLKVNPFVSVSETFSDNIYYLPTVKISDSITTITPGVRLQLPFQTHVADLEFYRVMNIYHKYTDENINDDHFNAAVDFRAGERYELKLSDRVEHGHEPRSSTPTETNEEFHSNVAAAAASYRLTDSFTMQLDLGKSSWRFIDSSFRDREEDQIAGTVFYRVLPKASVFIEYSHRNITYDEETHDLDSKADTVQAGLTWDISTRTRGTLKVGVERKDFTSTTRRDVTVNVWSADVRHDFTGDTTVVLTAQRSLNEPDILGIDYLITTGCYAELTQRFVQKWEAVVRGAYVQDMYSSWTNRTALYGAGLRYRAQDWLEFSVDYNRHQRDAGFLDKYLEHSTILMVNLMF